MLFVRLTVPVIRWIPKVQSTWSSAIFKPSFLKTQIIPSDTKTLRKKMKNDMPEYWPPTAPREKSTMTVKYLMVCSIKNTITFLKQVYRLLTFLKQVYRLPSQTLPQIFGLQSPVKKGRQHRVSSRPSQSLFKILSLTLTQVNSLLSN